MLIGIQLLRFIAAASVLFAHTLHQYEGLKPVGVFGVDIFFVISGFIIYFITSKDRSLFLVKRVIRIVPLYWAFTLLLAVIALVLPDLLKSAKFDLAHLGASLLFVPYWTEGTLFSPMLKLGWTLNFEMLFYLIFFLAMKISFKHRGILCSAGLTALFLGLNIFEVPQRSAFEFYSSSMWFEFIFGMFLAMGVAKLQEIEWSPYLLTGALVIAFGTLIGFDYVREGEPVYRVIYWGLPSIFIVGSFILLEGYLKSIFGRAEKLCIWLGEMSYPMYLIHIYVIVLLQRVLFKEISAPVLLVLTLLLTLVFSHIATRMYDLPIRRYLSRRISVDPAKQRVQDAMVEAVAR